jgi:asparagine synthase (glutamine-hydrolysing)
MVNGDKSMGGPPRADHERRGGVLESISTIGDLLLTFSDDVPTSGRSAGAKWAKLGWDDWTLWGQETSDHWRGFPVRIFSLESWRVVVLGELYGGPTSESSYVSRVTRIVERRQPGSAINGHALLLAWNVTARRWHVWTDRFATIHCYLASNGSRAAVGTFFPDVAGVASRKELDWQGLAGFFAFGFFPGDRTFFRDVRILRPASHYELDEQGTLVLGERYWQWEHRPEHKRRYDETLDALAAVLNEVLDEQSSVGRLAVPISGGLDSRTTVAVLTRADRARNAGTPSLWAYSYGYGLDSVEIAIARRVAAARRLPFEALEVPPYLFRSMSLLTSRLEGFQDITSTRQACVVDLLRDRADAVVAAHWGDVWLDDMGLAMTKTPIGASQALSHAMKKISKPGGEWLARELTGPPLGGESLNEVLTALVQDELAPLEHIQDPDFRIKAFKTEQWSFRWTLVGIRMHQAGAFPRLPFYDQRICDFFATVPSHLLIGRRLQVDYLKRFAPDLARVTWQVYDANLYQYQHFRTWLLPKRVVKKMRRVLTRQRPPQRNWEVQFAGEEGQSWLRRWLLQPGLRLHEFMPPDTIANLLDEQERLPPEGWRGYQVAMLLTFSSWLESLG